MIELDTLHWVLIGFAAVLLVAVGYYRSGSKAGDVNAERVGSQRHKSDEDLGRLLDLVERIPDLSDWEGYQVYLIRNEWRFRKSGYPGAPPHNTITFEQWRGTKRREAEGEGT